MFAGAKAGGGKVRCGVKEQAIRVFVVDDHQVVRMGLKTMLESEPDIVVVGDAESGADALEQLATVECDLVLTDLRMKGMTGAAMLTQLRQLRPELRTAVLTNYHSDEDVFSALKVGAMAFLLKSAPLKQLTAAIRMVHSGQHWIPPHIAQQLAQRLSRDQISNRELEILQLVARGKKNHEIADMLFISENTVRKHVISLLEKLDSRDRTEATSVAIRQGLVVLDED
jgi:DNA-binding NarL/FixJ family response regulator